MHPLNAYAPMLVKLLDNLTFDNNEQSIKTSTPIEITLSGITISFKDFFENTAFSIFFNTISLYLSFNSILSEFPI